MQVVAIIQTLEVRNPKKLVYNTCALEVFFQLGC
jgi:hypothetical protein